MKFLDVVNEIVKQKKEDEKQELIDKPKTKRQLW